jgi:hypothetical protein
MPGERSIAERAALAGVPWRLVKRTTCGNVDGMGPSEFDEKFSISFQGAGVFLPCWLITLYIPY